jgi:tetratricopeptide (TPR) repeat protein
MRDSETTTLGTDDLGPSRPSGLGDPSSAASPRLSPPHPPDPVFPAGELVAGRFRILRLLGRGGTAQVFEAADAELGQNVAIKVLRPDRAAGPRARDQLRREVLLARRVTHPNVCRIFDVFPHLAGPDAPAMLVLVMELLRGETLARRLARGGPLATAEALPLIRQLAEALDAAHRSQVVHGDFKSGNVILEPAAGGMRAVVTDFGLARHPALAGGWTGGTTGYMAPEQPAAEATPASDLYALGVVIHEMVTGRRPPPAEGPAAEAGGRAQPFRSVSGHPRRPAAGAVATGGPSRPAAGGGPPAPDLPPPWAAVLARCLARAPRDRPASAGEVARALAAGLSRGQGARAAGRGRLAAGAALMAALLACLGPLPLRFARPEGPAANALAGPVAERPALAIAADWPSRSPGLDPRHSPISAGLDLRHSQMPAGLDPRRSRMPAGLDPRYAWVPAALGHLVSVELAASGRLEVFQLPGPAPRRPASPPAEILAVASVSMPEGDPTGGGRLATGRPSGSGSGRSDRAEPALRTAETRQAADPTIRVELLLQRPPSDKLVARLVETGPLSELAALATRLGDRLRRALDLGEATPQERAAARSLRPADLATEALYAQGVALLRAGRPLAAYPLLARAAAADPGHTPSHAALARVAAELGYGRQAHEEAARLAVPVSRLLPEQERLEIAAIARAAGNDLPGAAGLFRALWQAAPYRLDHGLQLARAQLAAGRSREALAMIEAVRDGAAGRAQGAADWPALDVLAARAHYDLSEFHAAFEAARAAEAKAQRAGDAFALANALVEEASARIAERNGDAGPPLAQARGLFQRLGFRPGEARTLQVSASVALYAGEVERALDLQGQALAIFEQAAATAGAAKVRVEQAAILRTLGRQRDATPLLTRALADFRALGDRQGEGLALNRLAVMEAETGQPQQAERHFLDAASLASELGNRQGLAAALSNLGGLEMMSDNNFTAARQHYQQALRIAEELGFKKAQAVAHINLGNVREAEGSVRAARPEIWQALRLAREIDDRYLEARALGAYGLLLTEEGRLGLAEAALRRTLALEAAGGERAALPGTWLDLARLDLRASRFAAAEGAVRQAVAALDRLGAGRPERKQAGAYLAMAEVGLGRLDEARRILDEEAPAASPAPAATLSPSASATPAVPTAPSTQAASSAPAGSAAPAAPSAPATHSAPAASAASATPATSAAGAEDPPTVLLRSLATARWALASARPDDALRALRPVLQRFSCAPFPELVVEGRLLAGQADLAAGRAAQACGELNALAGTTERQGFLFVAREARRLSGAAGCRPPAQSPAGPRS